MILELALALCTAATVAVLGHALSDVMGRGLLGRVDPARRHGD
jgi:hypothetical protein